MVLCCLSHVCLEVHVYVSHTPTLSLKSGCVMRAASSTPNLIKALANCYYFHFESVSFSSLLLEKIIYRLNNSSVFLRVVGITAAIAVC